MLMHPPPTEPGCLGIATEAQIASDWNSPDIVESLLEHGTYVDLQICACTSQRREVICR